MGAKEMNKKHRSIECVVVTNIQCYEAQFLYHLDHTSTTFGPFETPVLAYNVSFHLLDHVKNRFILPQPDVMIGNCHPLKGNTLCVLEK